MATNDVTLRVGFDIDKFQSELIKTNGILDSWGKNVNRMVASYLSFQALKTVGQDMIKVTATFQKFGALLTNTLGSSSESAKALSEIRKFAVETPFEIEEITAAYVRWANMGLDPTIERMRKIGDVASSLGAGFEQTAEAFKDLMVGQTKRIEEVGISATQTNGKIQLSFKGVKLEIDKTADGVQQALDVFSQLNGVLGTSDSIAKTLGGQISNLSDAWNNFLLSIGNNSSGTLSTVVITLTNLLNGLSKETATVTENVSWWEKALEAVGIVTDNVRKKTLHLGQGSQSTWEENTTKIDEQKEAIRRAAEAAEKAKKAYEEWQKIPFKSKANFDFRKDIEPNATNIYELTKPDGMPSKVGPVDVSKQLAANQQSIDRMKQQALELKSLVADMSGSLSSFIADFAYSIGQSFNQNIDFGSKILKAIAGFAKSFGEQLIALGVAALALKYTISNPWVAIAAGAALVVAAGALESSANTSVRSIASGGSGTASRGSVSGNTQNMSVNVTGTLYGQGTSLVAVIDNTNQANLIRRGPR